MSSLSAEAQHDSLSIPSLLDTCDRTRSREARASLELLFWRPLGARRTRALPPDCPLAPAADILLGAERAKRRLSAARWQCRLCSKQFRTEHYLDKHLARRHTALSLPAPAPYAHTCFADLCGVAVPCAPASRAEAELPSVSSHELRRARGNAETTVAAYGMPLPSPSLLPQRRRACTDPTLRAAHLQACRHALGRCVVDVAARRAWEAELCVQAHNVECMDVDERVEWARAAGRRGEDTFFVSARHVLGWLLLAVLLVVWVISRALRNAAETDGRIAVGRFGMGHRKQRNRAAIKLD